jgi:hypothetical protein
LKVDCKSINIRMPIIIKIVSNINAAIRASNLALCDKTGKYEFLGSS